MRIGERRGVVSNLEVVKAGRTAEAMVSKSCNSQLNAVCDVMENPQVRLKMKELTDLGLVGSCIMT